MVLNAISIYHYINIASNSIVFWVVNMSGVYSGVQARLISKQKLSTYIHCASFELGSKRCNRLQQRKKTTFGLVKKIYTFFFK